MYVYRCTRALMRSKAFSTCTSPRTSVRQRHHHTAQSIYPPSQSIQTVATRLTVNPSSQWQPILPTRNLSSQYVLPVDPSRQSTVLSVNPSVQSQPIRPVNLSSQSTHHSSQPIHHYQHFEKNNLNHTHTHTPSSHHHHTITRHCMH